MGPPPAAVQRRRPKLVLRSLLALALEPWQAAAVSEFVLCLDAATPSMVLALGVRGEALPRASFVREDHDRKNSEEIAKAITSLCEQLGIRALDLQHVACGVGPGTFTGTRVAVATAKGLAFASKAQCWAVDSLSLFAASRAAQAPGLVALDARRGELYCALYGPDAKQPCGWSCLREPRCVAPSEALRGLDVDPQWIRGTGRTLLSPEDQQDRALEACGLDARSLWLASAAAMEKNPVPVAQLDVCYLRASYAEIGANPPKQAPYHSPFVSACGSNEKA